MRALLFQVEPKAIVALNGQRWQVGEPTANGEQIKLYGITRRTVITVATTAVVEVEICGARGPHDLDCDLPSGHDGNHSDHGSAWERAL